MRSALKKAYNPFFLIPAAAIYLIFFVLPVLMGFILAFTDWNSYTTELHFVGLHNFVEAFNHRVNKAAIKNTLIFPIISSLGKNIIGLMLAIFFNEKFRLRNYARTIFYVPSILSSVAIGLMFTSILHPSGLLNTALKAIGLDFLAHDWLVEPGMGIISVAFVEIWQWAGYHMTIFLAGLQAISSDYYEAARIDGAGWWTSLRRITIPLLMPAFSVNIVLSLIGGFKVFGPVYVLTGGGPGYSTQVVSTFVFKAFGEGNWALGNAANMILFIVIAIISMTVLRYLRKKEDEIT